MKHLSFSEIALRERVKELACLYEISELSQKENLSLTQLLNKIVTLIPPAWQYSDIAVARITFAHQSYVTYGFKETACKQIEKIIINKKEKGVIEVYYLKKMPRLDEGPFLKEERKLLQTVAMKVAFIIERREAEEKMKMLQEQIQHADRLATIGKLTAGITHELNTPLNSILGFAQLIIRNNNLSEQVK